MLTAIVAVGTWWAMANGREVTLFDSGWRFALGNAADASKDFDHGRGDLYAKAAGDRGPVSPSFSDSSWRKVDLPHDWVVELPFVRSNDSTIVSHGFKPVGRDYPDSSVGWYRKSFEVPLADKGRRIRLRFDGVFRDSRVWLNGHQVGANWSGYMGFTADLTDFINYGGKNVLAVRCDASYNEGWFYEGGGIYRHVWMEKVSPIHIENVFVTTETVGKDAHITIRTRVVNESEADAPVDVTNSVASKELAKISTTVGAGEHADLTTIVKISDARLWSPDDPQLYKLETAIAGDSVTTTVGVRTVVFDKDKGLFINGKHYLLKGVCCHQDHAGVGSAIPDRLNEWRLEQLKSIGVNAYRCSHNPPTPELLDACDRLGILVMDENRLLNSSPEGLSQLERLIVRDRNHPSVILWSLANEESEATTDRGGQIGATMIRKIRSLDPTRAISYASNAGNSKGGVLPMLDWRGFNYKNISNIDQYRTEHPEQKLFGSEEASTITTRGIYTTDPSAGYMSAYDLNQPGWGATAEDWWTFYDARSYLAGAFVWTGFDYRGEPTPYQWPCISSHFGILDTCGYPKDVAYYYKTWWTDKPTLHVFPHWNWKGKEGQLIDVWAYSNQGDVELFLNGKSLGKKAIKKDGHAEWKVAYQPGTLEARSGTLTERIETTGNPSKLVLSADRSAITADGRDLSVIAVSTVDDKGRHVPIAANKVHFEVEGPGRILGVGNGDPTCHEPDRYFATGISRRIEGWHLVRHAEGKPVPLAVEGEAVTLGDATGLEPNERAFYTATFNLSQAELKKDWTLQIPQVDDQSEVYLNGRLIGTTKVWDQSYEFKASGLKGTNVIVVAAQNNAGQGGMAKGVALSSEGEEPAWSRSLFNGWAQIIVQSTGQPGSIRLKATAEGLTSTVLEIKAK